MGSAVAMRVLGSLSSGSAGRAKLLTLTYHRVLPRADPLLGNTVDTAAFDWQMRLLAERFNVLPLTHAVTLLAQGRLPSRSACITFDDGYADNATLALPILRRYGLTATFFIATAFLDGGRMWNDTVIESVRRARGDTLDLSAIEMAAHAIGDAQDRCRTIDKLLRLIKYLPLHERARKAQAIAEHVGETLPDDLMMSTRQMRDLQAAGMEVGAHTVNHPILTQLGVEQAEQEIKQARARLQELGIAKPDAFAYPNGRPGIDYDRNHVLSVRRAGFKVAVSSAWGYAAKATDPFQVPRIDPWDRKPHSFNLRMLRTYVQQSAAAV